MKKSNTKKHPGRTDLIGEHAFGDLGQLILLAIFAIVWITDSFIFKYSLISMDVIPNSYRMIIAFPLLIVSGYLAKQGLGIIFGEHRKKPEVIEKGVFKIVRHPIYLGSILLYTGLTILACSIASAIVWLIIVIFYYYISKYEEKILLDEFGSDYRGYQKRVPMLIPRFFKMTTVNLLILCSVSVIIAIYTFTDVIHVRGNTGKVLFGTVWLLLGIVWFGKFISKNKKD